MNTPNENPEQNSSDQTDTVGSGAGRYRTQRAAFWLRMIDVRKHKLTHEYRKSLRHTAREGISDEEYAAMLGTLEKMARNLGWDESQNDERPFGRGFGRGHRHPAMMGFGAGHHGFGHGHGHDDEHDDDHHEHRYPGAKRGFRRMHPADHHRDPHTGNVATDTPQA